MSALDTQVGGSHYKDLKIQPVEYITANNIPYMEGNVIKYVTRWREKGGLRDLEKAKHYLDMLIEMQNQKAKDGLLKLVEKELEDCKGEAEEKRSLEPKVIHYMHVRHYIRNNSVESDFVEDRIKPYGKVLIKEVSKEVHPNMWLRFAALNCLGVNIIKRRFDLSVYNPTYDVELWLKK